MDAALSYPGNQKGDPDVPNKRNGHLRKTLKSQFGEFQVDIPRDRNGEPGIEEQIISLYGRGRSTREIFMISSKIPTESKRPQKWSAISQTRSFQRLKNGRPGLKIPSTRLFLWTASIIKFGRKAEILSRTAYIVLGATTDGYKEILSISCEYRKL